MKRFGLIFVLAGLFASPALSQAQVARPNTRGGQAQQPQARQEPSPQEQQQNQIRQNIADLYISDFRREVELTEDQFIKLSFFIRSFIQMRFRTATLRDDIKQQLERLQAQTNPSVQDIEELRIQKARVDNAFANQENDFLGKIRADLRPGQVLLFFAFNTKFEERLLGLIEQARAAAAQRGQQAPAPNRQNVNPNRQNINGPNRGDAFRDQQKQQNR
jgi:hypothetical protein